jgi:hypothetical protein
MDNGSLLENAGAHSPECPLIKKCALIMNRSEFLKRVSSSGMGIDIENTNI